MRRKPRCSARALAGFVLVLAGLAALAGWYFRLQVLRHDEFATRSEANRLRMVPVVPARGLIVDRRGRILPTTWRRGASTRCPSVPARVGR